MHFHYSLLRRRTLYFERASRKRISISLFNSARRGGKKESKLISSIIQSRMRGSRICAIGAVCVHNYEASRALRTFNIASEIGERVGGEKRGLTRLAAVIKFSKPLLVYLRPMEPEVNTKSAGCTTFCCYLILTGFRATSRSGQTRSKSDHRSSPPPNLPYTERQMLGIFV